MQVLSYFEDLVTRKIVMQFKFNLDAQFNSYNFFSFGFTCMWMMSAVYSCMHARILSSI